MPQFDLQWFSGEAFWMLLCFGILYLIVTYFIFPLFQDVFQDRYYKIKNDLTIAEMVNQQADKLVQDYKNRIYAAQETKAAIVNETYRDIQKFATHVEAEHEEKLRRQIEETEQKMHRIQEDILHQSETVAVQVAQELSHKLSTSFKPTGK